MSGLDTPPIGHNQVPEDWKPGSFTERQPAVVASVQAVDRALLERCGLVNAAGQVVGAEGPHPDAALLDMINRYTTLMHASRRLFYQARQYNEDGRAFKRLWREMLATRPQQDALEREIANTKATTILGLVAKMGVWVDMHGDNSGTMIGHPIGTMREAMAMLGEVGAND